MKDKHVMDPLTIDSSGRLSVPGYAVRQLGQQQLELTSYSSRHLLFTVPGEEEVVVLSGSIGEITVADLLSFCNMFRKTGVLSVTAECGRRDLYFQNGEVVFAGSTCRREALEEILLELGKLDAQTLEKVRGIGSGTRSVGKMLVESKAVAAKDLWLATRHQVESIVYGLLAVVSGNFHFSPEDPERDGIVRLSMSTQNLIMEGLRRVDERELFMRRIPSLEAHVILTGREVEDLSGGEKKIVDLVLDGRRVVRELIRASGVGEFDGLRILYQLCERGVVQVDESPEVELDGALGDILAIGNRVLALLFKAISAAKPDFLHEVTRFLRSLPQPYSFLFGDTEVRSNGSVDGGHIIANLEGLEEGDKEKLLAEGLCELIYMECQAARRELGADKAAELVQAGQDVSDTLMNRAGR
ncbi:MAG: hypothetical protein C0624_06810 [Desulfuromonas sp.]|nr:MAG: hypothetical protein C0624_06810 [Desulfuromonas sp.]